MLGLNNKNVYYFPDNIDVRTCNKNGLTSIKHLWTYIEQYYDKRNLPNAVYEFRKQHEEFARSNKYTAGVDINDMLVNKYGDSFDIPFRKNSTRMAIWRDPIDRFKSAVEMLQIVYSSENESNQNNIKNNKIEEKYRKNYPSFFLKYDMFNNYKHEIDIDGVLDKLESGEIINSHFFTQTFYMGNRDQYDHIYSMSSLNDMTDYLMKRAGVDSSVRNIQFRTNVSLNTNAKMLQELQDKEANPNVRLKLTYIDGTDFNKETATNAYLTEHFATGKRITDNLKESQINRIKKLYKVDYINGWCKVSEKIERSK